MTLAKRVLEAYSVNEALDTRLSKMVDDINKGLEGKGMAHLLKKQQIILIETMSPKTVVQRVKGFPFANLFKRVNAHGMKDSLQAIYPQERTVQVGYKDEEGLVSAVELVIDHDKLNEELSQDVQDKIKANNDKMTELKNNGGSQEEIDALEKENDELNGGNETSESISEDDSIPAKFEIALGKLANKPAARQAEILTYGIKNLMARMGEKPVTKMEAKQFASFFLGMVQNGVEDIAGSEVEEDK